MDDINKKNNLLRYLAGMGVVISLLLFAGTCDVKSNNNHPDVGGDTACKEGFKIEMAKESYGKAFKVGKLAKDESTGSYSADVTVTLSALTRGNGFVSNHVWLHPDKVAPQAYRDGGVYEHNEDATKAKWTPWTPAVGNAPNPTRDGIFCQGTGTTLDTHIDEGAISDIVKDALTREGATKAANQCKDLDVGGVFISKNGTVQGMQNWVFGADTTTNDNYEDVLVTVQPADDIDTTGIYYLRDNFSSSYMISTGGGDADADGKLFHANDSDALYAEYEAVFGLGGVPLACLGLVFSSSVNGINLNFIGQNRNAPVPVDAKDGAGMPLTSAPVAESLGGNKDEGAGGWQKLFTLKPCDDTMKNGFAVAQALVNDAAVTEWKSKPYLQYTEDVDNLFQKVHVRNGEATDDTNTNALLFDSVVGADSNGNNELGLFTIRHHGLDSAENATDIAAMTDAQNAVATKGQIVCRSAIALETKENVKKFFDTTTDEDALAAIAEKVTGYVDGEIKDDNKGLGMTCYLGLTALWPEAVDGAPQLVKSYNLQFAGDKMVADKFDVSDKKVGILLVNMKKDIAINHEKLKPFFAKPLAENSVLLSKPAGITAVKGLKDGEDVNYKHGVMTLKFVK